MSSYKQFQASGRVDYPLESRKSRVHVSDFAQSLSGPGFSDFLHTLPNILAGRDLRMLVEKIRQARHKKRALIWGFGGHVIKVGLAPLLIDLMNNGFVTAFATNGSGMIHDFEIALSGATSEDVERSLRKGSFGMARETGEILNRAINQGAGEERGIGESVGVCLGKTQLRHPSLSVFHQAHRRHVPVTVHVAIGTDIIHNHPLASGEALGKGSQIDFRILTHQVSLLRDGGVYLNLGSAVLLPEVFLKAVSLVRNSGCELENFTTANLDFIQHYRPLQNVVRRPVAASGTGIALTGHHEIMIPMLAAMLLSEEAPTSAGRE
ncbi:MAG: hypothetical protein ACE5JX_08900 [Acidobacteriota bacterium]